MNNQLQTNQASAPSTFVSAFDDVTVFDQTMRMASALSKSAFVPKVYQGSPESCLVAIDVARRLGVPVLTLLPHLYVIDNKPAFSTQFLITLVNRSGLFDRLEWETGIDGETEVNYCDWKGSQKETWKETVPNHFATARLRERRTGKVYVGQRVDVKFAELNGWTSKPGSKWRTMPEAMCAYRSASILIKRTCPELTMGMEVAEDISDAVATVDYQQDVYVETSRPALTLEAAPAVNPVETLAASLESAQNQDELAAVADEIKKAGVQGSDRARLGKIYKAKLSELEPEPEPEEEPKDTEKANAETTADLKAGFKAALERADSLETLEDVRATIELETTQGTLSGSQFGELTEVYQKRAAELKAPANPPRFTPTTSQKTNYNGLVEALEKTKSKEEVAKLIKGCDGYVAKGLLTHDQGLSFYDACRRHEEKLLI